MFYAIVAGKIWSMITFVTKDNFNYSFAIVVSLFLIPLGLYSHEVTHESATLENVRVGTLTVPYSEYGFQVL